MKTRLIEGSVLSPEMAGLSPEQVAKLATDDIIGLNSAPKIPRSFLEENGLLYNEFRFLKDLGRIPSSAEWSQVRTSFDREVMAEVLANPGAYGLQEFRYNDGEGNGK